MQGRMGMFGVPFTQIQTTETAFYIIPQVGATWLFFFFFKGMRGTLWYEGRTTVHDTGQKAQHWTQTKGNNTQGALKRPRDNKVGGKSAPQWDVFWAFLAARGLLKTPISRIKLHDIHSRGEIKQHIGSHIKIWALRPDWTRSGSMTTAKGTGFSFFFSSSLLKCILFVHAWYNITASNMFFIQRMVYQSDQCQW